jgi:hypothetical protein
LAIHSGQRCPQLAGCRCVTGSDGDPHHFPRVPVKGQPDPLPVACVYHKRPEFITCNGQTTLFVDRTRTSRGTLRYFSFTYVCSHRSDTPTARAMPASGLTTLI